MTDPLVRPAPADGAAHSSGRRPPPRSGLTLVLTAPAGGAGLFLAWQAAGALLLIFAGLLVAALLDACTRGLARVLPVGRVWRLTIVCALIALGTAWLLLWSGYNLVQQADSLVRLVGEQLHVLRGELRSMGVAPPPSPEGDRARWPSSCSGPGTLFGHAYSAFSLASGLLGDVVVAVFIGLFAAASPQTYRRGVLALFPRDRRQRCGEVLDEMAGALRRWLVGQLVAGVLIAITTWAGLALIGMPGAPLLGL